MTVEPSRSAGTPTARGRQAESGRPQPPDELTTVHLERAGRHHLGSKPLWHVVVVTLEAASRDPDTRCEGVQLLERGVAHQMTPPLLAKPPSRLVDQDRHRASLAHRPRWATVRPDATLARVSSHEAELRIAWRRHLGRTAQLDALLGRYREPHRHYHGLGHLTWTIRHVHELARHETVTDLGAVVAAAFFHDAVHDPTRVDNERASARLARTSLGELGWTIGRADAVATMVLATAGHLDTPESDHDTDTAVLLDADLAVLGTEPGAYHAYVNGVRAEYAHLDDAAWRTGRRDVLRRLLARAPIYLTPTARGRWESRARANLVAELATLG